MIARIRDTMSKHPDLCIVILATAFSVLLSRTQSVSKPGVIREAPWPQRFFPHHSPVRDDHFGQLTPLESLVMKEELVFVMYYAPWCAKSMELRWHFHRAAHYLRKKVTFVAINCWWPSGQCRKKHTFYSYPMFFVHHVDLDPFLYRGIPAVEHILAFLDHFLKPLQYITTFNGLTSFFQSSPNTVVGYFNLSATVGIRYFNQFYYAALRTYVLDPYNVVPFAVLCDKVTASIFSMQRAPTVLLGRSLNETLVFPAELDLTSYNLVKWISNNLSPPEVSWVVPTGSKSLTLNEHILPGPTVILFTEINPLSEFNHYFTLLREVALNYYNCDNTSKIQNIITQSIEVRLEAPKNLQSLQAECRKLRKLSSKRDETEELKCCLSVVIDDFHSDSNHHNVCDICLSNTLSYSHCGNMVLASSVSLTGTKRSGVRYCNNKLLNYNANELVSTCCSPVRKNNSPALYGHTTAVNRPSDFYTQQGKEALLEDRCSRIHLNKLRGYSHFESQIFEISDDKINSFTGSGCRTNKTVTFIAMDSRYHSVFKERLGFENPMETALTIIDRVAESQYNLQEKLSKKNIVSYLERFARNNISAALRSEEPIKPRCQSEVQLITEVSTKTFQKIVLNPSKDVVLLYSATWCGYCSAFAFIYLTLARYFRGVESIVFARIDGEKNDLPWQYKAGIYPSVVFFPSQSKADSFAFPDAMPKTVSNLVKFILKHATQKVKIRAVLGKCSSECIKKNRARSLQTIRHLQKNIEDIHTRISVIGLHIARVKTTLEHHSKQEWDDETCPHDLLDRYKLKTFMHYTKVLKRLIFRRKLQLHSTKAAHRILVDSGRQSIGPRDLATILKQNARQRTMIRNFQKSG